MQNDGQDIGIERSEGEIPNWRSTSMPEGDRSLTIRRLRSSKLFGLVAKLASGRDATIGTSNLPIEQRITQSAELTKIPRPHAQFWRPPADSVTTSSRQPKSAASSRSSASCCMWGSTCA
jgi:hypothetical protein